LSKEELFDCLKRLSKTDNLRDGIDIKKEEANIIVNEIERLNNIINKGIEYIQDRYDGEVLTHTFDKCNVGELLNILKEVIKSENIRESIKRV